VKSCCNQVKESGGKKNKQMGWVGKKPDDKKTTFQKKEGYNEGGRTSD